MKTAREPKNNQNCRNIKQKRKKLAKKIIIALAICFVLLPAIGIGIFAVGFAIWAQGVQIDASLLPTQTSAPTFYFSDGSEIDYAKNDYVLPAEMSTNLKNAFIAVEDKRFYTHKGYDIVRIGGAVLKNVASGKMKEGASTITQQLVKNTHLTSERTLSRKLKEIAIASKLEKQYSKDEILSMYLSVIYFGSGAYGVREASRLFFAKEVEFLNLGECATLAGIVKNPRDYSPLNNEKNALERRNLVLRLMKEQNLITQNQLDATLCEKLSLAKISEKDEKNKLSNSLTSNDCKLYLDGATKEVCKRLDITKYQLDNSGIKIFTNLDKHIQLELKNQTYNSVNFSSDDVLCASAVVNSRSGAVVAYHSPLSYEVSRQAGSTLKPLAVYAPAIDMSLVSLATPIADEKIEIGGYSPSNFGDVYYGETTIKDAVCKSMNSVALKTLNYVGVQNAVGYLNNFGIETQTDDQNYALSLGATAKGTTPLELACAYSTIARGGEWCDASFVKCIVKDGVKTSFDNLSKRQTIKASTASLLSVALMDTVKCGTAKGLDYLPFELAAKTGTAERADKTNSDAWCVSYNNDYTLAVWHGSDGVLREKGGSYPTKHSANVWEGIASKKPLSQKINLSSDVKMLDVDLYSTKLNKQVTLATKNTPREYCKAEYFAIANLPSAQNSRFENIQDKRLEISVENGVEVSFETEEIFNYKLYRTDVFGEVLIASFAGKESSQIDCDIVKFTINDTPISFDGKVKYRLHVELKNNPTVCADEEVEVYIKNEFADWHTHFGVSF